MPVDDFMRALDDAGASYEPLAHVHTESASAEAHALGLSADGVDPTSTPELSSAARSRRQPSPGQKGLEKSRARWKGHAADALPRLKALPDNTSVDEVLRALES